MNLNLCSGEALSSSLPSHACVRTSCGLGLVRLTELESSVPMFFISCALRFATMKRPWMVSLPPATPAVWPKPLSMPFQFSPASPPTLRPCVRSTGSLVA
ncbi:hypothetical protein D3C81_1757260 [compost metagenome]